MRRKEERMYIGEVSKRTGATPKAIRLYEALGLIPVPERKGAYRNFHEQDVELIQIIKQAQQLGFKLSEMKALLHKEASCQNFPWHLALRLVREKIEKISSDIARLELQKQELTKFTELLSAKNCQEISSTS